MNRAREMWARLPLSGRLAVFAALLGVGALAIGDPRSAGRVTVDTRELAAIVQGEVDHVTPAELADWLIAGRNDFRLIDLREAAEFAAYHIPNAENLTVTGLVAAELPRNEKIVLYSAEGIHSAQAWFFLAAQRYPAVYILLGGLKAWQEEVLFPVQPAAGASPAELASFARAAEVAKHFGGGPRAATAGEAQLASAAPPALPTPTVVAPPAPVAGGAAPKKKKEGC